MTDEQLPPLKAIYDKIMVLPRVFKASTFSKELSKLLQESLSDEYAFFPGLSHVYHAYNLGPSLAGSEPRHFVASVIFLDLGLTAPVVLHEISRARSYFIDPVFVFCSSPQDEADFAAALSPEDTERYIHYYRLDKKTLGQDQLLDILEEASQTAIQKRDVRRSVDVTLFVSYSRKNLKFAYQLTLDLKNQGYHVWLDKSELAGGDDWMSKIDQALASSDILLLIASPDSLASNYVKLEYRTILEHEKPVIPILIEPVDNMPFELAPIQYVDLTDITDKHEKLDLVLQAIRKQRQNTLRDREQD